MAQQLSDLWEECETCEGTGKVESDPSSGSIAVGGEECPDCHGDGGSMTNEGRAIRDFLQIITDKKKFYDE